MAQTTLNKQTHGLIGKYIQLWTAKYRKAPVINRYREKWGFQSMIEDLGYDRALKVTEYYFKTDHPGHPVNYLLFNYDKFHNILNELEDDEVNREKLRRATEARVREWEARHGN